MNETISDNELLIIRHLKRNNPNDALLRRLVGRYYLLHPEHVDKVAIFNCLFGIIEKFDLFIHSDKHPSISGFFTNREFYVDQLGFKDMWDEWIWRATSRIRLSGVNKFPRYPSPAYFRNKKLTNSNEPL